MAAAGAWAISLATSLATSSRGPMWKTGSKPEKSGDMREQTEANGISNIFFTYHQ